MGRLGEVGCVGCVERGGMVEGEVWSRFGISRSDTQETAAADAAPRSNPSDYL